jgi:hypothetical protein
VNLLLDNTSLYSIPTPFPSQATSTSFIQAFDLALPRWDSTRARKVPLGFAVRRRSVATAHGSLERDDLATVPTEHTPTRTLFYILSVYTRRASAPDLRSCLILEIKSPPKTRYKPCLRQNHHNSHSHLDRANQNARSHSSRRQLKQRACPLPGAAFPLDAGPHCDPISIDSLASPASSISLHATFFSCPRFRSVVNPSKASVVTSVA